MTDAPSVVEPSATPTPPPAVAPAAPSIPDAPKAPDAALAGVLSDAGGTDAPAAREPDVSDVRRLLAGDDQKFAKQLDRFTTADDMRAAWQEAQKAASKKAEPLSLADDATDEQVNDFRKAIGIPEKAEEYPIGFRDGYEVSDADKEILTSLKDTLHQRAGDPRTAAIAMDWYQDTIHQQLQDLNELAVQKSEDTQELLRGEYGAEYKGNIEAANQLMRSQMGGDAYDAILDKRFDDGTKLQDDPSFVKMMVNLGRDYYGGTSIISGDVETTIKTVDEKIAEFNALQLKSPDEYYSSAVQEKVAALYAQKEKLAKRKG